MKLSACDPKKIPYKYGTSTLLVYRIKKITTDSYVRTDDPARIS